MNIEYKICCSNCIHCVRTIPDDDDAVEKSGMIAFHKCFFDRPEYDFYGGCVLYEKRYDC